MATESSAIARFVNSAQSQAIDDPERREGIVDVTMPVRHLSKPMAKPMAEIAMPTQARSPAKAKSQGGGAWLALIGIVVIGGAVAGGYLLAQQQSADQGAATAAAPVAPQAAQLVESAAGKVEDAAVLGAAQPAEETIEPDTDPGPAAAGVEGAGEALPVIDMELAKKTGFDILVEPTGARVSLDGHDIGVAPLRVRNLLPGSHGIDIEGPVGFFGKHMEFELAAGEAQVLELVLDAVEGQEDAAKAEPSGLQVEPIASSSESKSESAKARADKNKSKSKERAKSKERKSSSSSAKAERAIADKSLAGAGEVSLGTLMLGAKPPCQITIDGKSTGLTTPQRSIQLPEGSHRVVLSNKEHGINKSFKVNIKAGRTTRAIQDLSSKL